KFTYSSSPTADVLARPLETPKNFDWNSVYGLYVQGKENFVQRYYQKAEDKLVECLKKDSNFLPALTALALLRLRKMEYKEAFELAKKGLSIDTYDPAANYYYGLANVQLGNIADARDGFDLAALSMQYRHAASTEVRQ